MPRGRGLVGARRPRGSTSSSISRVTSSSRPAVRTISMRSAPWPIQIGPTPLEPSVPEPSPPSAPSGASSPSASSAIHSDQTPSLRLRIESSVPGSTSSTITISGSFVGAKPRASVGQFDRPRFGLQSVVDGVAVDRGVLRRGPGDGAGDRCGCADGGDRRERHQDEDGCRDAACEWMHWRTPGLRFRPPAPAIFNPQRSVVRTQSRSHGRTIVGCPRRNAAVDGHGSRWPQ